MGATWWKPQNLQNKVTCENVCVMAGYWCRSRIIKSFMCCVPRNSILTTASSIELAIQTMVKVTCGFHCRLGWEEAKSADWALWQQSKVTSVYSWTRCHCEESQCRLSMVAWKWWYKLLSLYYTKWNCLMEELHAVTRISFTTEN